MGIVYAYIFYKNIENNLIVIRQQVVLSAQMVMRIAEQNNFYHCFGGKRLFFIIFRIQDQRWQIHIPTGGGISILAEHNGILI